MWKQLAYKLDSSWTLCIDLSYRRNLETNLIYYNISEIKYKSSIPTFPILSSSHIFCFFSGHLCQCPSHVPRHWPAWVRAGPLRLCAPGNAALGAKHCNVVTWRNESFMPPCRETPEENHTWPINQSQVLQYCKSKVNLTRSSNFFIFIIWKPPWLTLTKCIEIGPEPDPKVLTQRIRNWSVQLLQQILHFFAVPWSTSQGEFRMKGALEKSKEMKTTWKNIHKNEIRTKALSQRFVTFQPRFWSGISSPDFEISGQSRDWTHHPTAKIYPCLLCSTWSDVRAVVSASVELHPETLQQEFMDQTQWGRNSTVIRYHSSRLVQ